MITVNLYYQIFVMITPEQDGVWTITLEKQIQMPFVPTTEINIVLGDDEEFTLKAKDVSYYVNRGQVDVYSENNEFLYQNSRWSNNTVGFAKQIIEHVHDYLQIGFELTISGRRYFLLVEEVTKINN